MAIFNPQNPDINSPQGLSYQGYRTEDRSGGGVLNTLASALDTGAKTANYTIDKAVENQVNAAVDKVQSLYGTDAATPSPDDLNTPPDLSKGLNRLDNLNQGYQNGSIKESHYLGQLNAVVKQLKSRFPGYEDRVDNWMQQKAGITPANALVSQLRQEAMAQLAGRNQSAKDRLDFEEANTESIIRKFGTSYFTDPTKRSMPMEQLMAGVGQIKAQDADVTAEKSALELLASQGKAQTKDYENFSRKTTAIFVGQLLDSGLGADFQEKMKELQNSGHTPTPEEQTQMKQMFATLKTNIITGVTKELSKPLGDGKTQPWFQLEKTTRDDILASATATVDALGEDTFNKDWGWAAIDGGLGQSLIQKDANQLLERDASIKRVAALKQVTGENLTGIILGSNLGSMSQSVLADLTAKAVVGDDNNPGKASILLDFNKLNDAESKGSKLDPKIYKSVISADLAILKDPTIKPEAKSKVVQYLFGNNDSSFLDMFQKETQTQVYANLVNPDVTKAVVATGDAAMWHNYSNWATNAFISLNKGIASDIQNIPKETMDAYTIRYNASRGQLEAIYNGADRTKDGYTHVPMNEKVIQAMVQQKFQQMNVALSSIKSVIEQDGLDMGATVKFLTQQMGIKIDTNDDDKRSGSDDVLRGGAGKDDLSQKDTTSFLNFIGSSEGASYNTMFGETKDDPKYSLTNMSVNEVMKLQKDIGGSGAAGKYQIQRSTLSYLKKQMGLDGTEFMTPELQDRMANVLLERRGIKDFAMGKKTKEQMANDLSKEWASLPSMSGQSYYEGDGVNHARVGLEDVYTQLALFGDNDNGSIFRPHTTYVPLSIPLGPSGRSAPRPANDNTPLDPLKE